MNKCSVFFVLLCSLPSIQLSAQLKDTSKFHFQMPAGVQYVTSSTWKPYQLNYLVGLSGMNKLSKHKPFIDWGLLVAIRPEKDTSSSTGGGDYTQPPPTGSELGTVNTGIGKLIKGLHELLQWAGGICYTYMLYTI